MKLVMSFAELKANQSMLNALGKNIHFTVGDKSFADSDIGKALAVEDFDAVLEELKEGGYSIGFNTVTLEISEDKIIAVAKVIETKATIIGKLVDAVASVVQLAIVTVGEVGAALKAALNK